jgi:hypothetical protein
METKELNLPSYLYDMVQPLPSSRDKLLAVWDGLSVENQIQILEHLRKCWFPILSKEVYLKALGSPNAYIRYVAGKRILELHKDDSACQNVESLLSSEHNPLVHYCQYERDPFPFPIPSVLDDPKEFYELPHEARLASVRTLTSSCKKMAHIFSYAFEQLIPQGHISKKELREIIWDYLGNPSFQVYYQNKQWWKDGDDGIADLWLLFLNIPDAYMWEFIRYLPFSGHIENIDNVLNKMNKERLAELLQRSDIGGYDCTHNRRSRIYFENIQNDNLRSAAVGGDFELKNREFSDILSRPRDEMFKLISELACYANNLSMCMYAAISDLLCSKKEYIYSEKAHDKLHNKWKTFESQHNHPQIVELRLYWLARKVAPWQSTDTPGPLPEKLSFLSEHISPGSTWKTFMAFSEAWRVGHYADYHLKYLPEIIEPSSTESLRNITIQKRRPNLPTKYFDFFSQVESGVHCLMVFIGFFGWPLIALLAINIVHAVIMNDEAPLFVRDIPLNNIILYSVYTVGIILCLSMFFGLCIMIADFFKWIRKIFGMKSIEQLEEEISTKRAQAEQDSERETKRWFAQLSEHEQKYLMYMIQQEQLYRLNEIPTKGSIIMIMIGGIVVIIAAIFAFYVINRYI